MLALASTIPAILLAMVLVISGLAKLRDRAAVQESFVTLRLPAALTRSVAPALLPWGELALAVALLVLPGWADLLTGVAAVGLFAAYLIVIARAVGFDPPVECGCLGRLGLGVVGPVTVVRNALLVGLALWSLADAALADRSVAARWLAAEAAGWAWLAVSAIGVAVAGLMVYARRDRAGTPAPAAPPTLAEIAEDDEDDDYVRMPIPFLPLERPDGERITLRLLASNQARLIVWINPHCGTCTRVLDRVPALRSRVPRIGTHLVFARAEDAAAVSVTHEALGDEWFVDRDSVVAQSMELASPSAFLLGADGYLAGGPVVGTDAVLEFFGDIVAALTHS